MTDLTLEDFTKHRINEEGTYRAFPVARTVERADSGAVAIAWKFAIAARWHGKADGWSEPYPVGWFVENRTWIVKKDKVDATGRKIGDGDVSDHRVALDREADGDGLVGKGGLGDRRGWPGGSG